MAVNMTQIRDTKWLTLEVCREFQRGTCSRPDSECKFAHPAKSCQVENGRVIACFDSLKLEVEATEPAGTPQEPRRNPPVPQSRDGGGREGGGRREEGVNLRRTRVAPHREQPLANLSPSPHLLAASNATPPPPFADALRNGAAESRRPPRHGHPFVTISGATTSSREVAWRSLSPPSSPEVPRRFLPKWNGDRLLGNRRRARGGSRLEAEKRLRFDADSRSTQPLSEKIVPEATQGSGGGGGGGGGGAAGGGGGRKISPLLVPRS
ncbi:hypothetical protein CRUP_030810 [Coryphaenoides rupestris]|nr:hypothetical protein CRUP_030810 [Coryphaenoides rupestris]